MNWRPVLRIARRDALRARGRSALIVAMVALPVLGVSFSDVMVRTGDVDAGERVDRVLGAADALIEPSPSGNPVVQPPDGSFTTSPTSVQAAEDTPPTDPRTVLPAGTRYITLTQADLRMRTSNGLTRARLRELDYTDPIAEGIVRQVDGRAPRSADEVVVTPALLDTLGTRVGDRLELVDSPRSLTIVGTFRDLDDGTPGRTALALPGAVLADAGG
jgi:putative ABC transport system permease protein